MAVRQTDRRETTKNERKTDRKTGKGRHRDRKKIQTDRGRLR